jgi:TolB-like protein
MPSIIEGYSYDIFVSYRQKDNKYDGWVTEFVENLKKELEATFKEEVCVYFDINPHDGLLETHDVDESLKEKLKCLVFIPIISRTYCDPNSFAWEHETKAFVELATKDQFGLKIRLPNGNVSSRILPVRIHELDINDVKLCESVFGGVLRGVEFIYKSPGVNRPLRAKEDKPQENLYNTIYRDQINKVANAIDEIISSLKSISTTTKNSIITDKTLENKTINKGKPWLNRSSAEISEKGKSDTVQKTSRKKKWWISIAISITLLMIFAFWYLWPFIFKPRIIPKDFNSSVAVLTFVNTSDSAGYENFVIGATNDLISRLARIQNLKVVPVNESLKYKQLQNLSKAISKDYEAKMVLQGSVKIEHDNVIITAELIDGDNDIVLLQQSEQGRLEDILIVQDEIASEVIETINNKYSNLHIQRRVRLRPTKNFKAYELFLKGNAELTKWTYESLKESVDYFDRALQIDQNFTEAYSNYALSNLLIVYFYEHNKYRIEAIKKNARKALALENDNEIALMSMEGYYIMKMSSGQKLGILEYRDMISKLKSLISKNPSSPMGLYGMAEFYRFLKRNLYESSEYLKMALIQCERILQDDPSNGIILGIAAQSAGLLGELEYRTGHFLEAIKYTEYSIKLVPFITRAYNQLAHFYFDTDQPQKAKSVLDQAIVNAKNDNDRAHVELSMGKYSMIQGEYHQAEKYWADAMIHFGSPTSPSYDYALLYRYVMLCKSGNQVVGDTLLYNRLKTLGISPWSEQIINFLMGTIEEEDLIKMAKKNWQKCEAFYFIGEKNLINGNLIDARQYFEESVNTNVTTYYEYEMSKAELNHTFQ